MSREEFTQKLFLLILVLCISIQLFGQETGFKGRVIDANTKDPLPETTVTIEGTEIATKTNTKGVFSFRNSRIPLGESIAVFSIEGYITKRYPIVINELSMLDLGTIALELDVNREQLLIGIISLSDNELEEGEGESSFSISGLLQASKDVFLNATAFDFSSTFFRPRGLGSEYGKVLINGIEMNKLANGRPQWSNWGGLNDVQRNQEFSLGIAPNEYTFGDLVGATNIIMRASQYKKGGRISYAVSNRTYTGRMMATYNSGLDLHGWAYSISLSRRFGNQGYIDGTIYEANSFFAAVEKRITNAHSISFTGFYTPNRRGRSAAMTQEVFETRGNTYNPYWGYYNGSMKNSRERRIEEPVFILSHYWNISENLNLNTNIGIQLGKIANSRLDTNGTDMLQFNGQETYFGGGATRTANPLHPNNLPSFYIQDANPTPLDYQNAFLAQNNLRKNGQVDWNQLIEANQLQAQLGNNAMSILYEDQTNDTQWNFNTIFNGQISNHIDFNAAVTFSQLQSQNYAEVTDLLGGNSFLDIDAFAINDLGFTQEELADRAQSDLRNRNRKVGVGDRFDYNYEITADVVNTFVQAQFQYNPLNFFIAANLSNRSYQRKGLFENGYFPGTQSFGNSPVITFTNYGMKGGTTLQLNGRHAISLQGTYATKAPTIRNTFANIRKNNYFISDLKEETIYSVDASYLLRTPKLKARVTGYYTDIANATEVGFFFTETISLEESRETAGFAQENLTGIAKRYFGTEAGLEYQVTPTLKLKAAAALGQFTYSNDPILTLSTDDGILSLGEVILKNYKLASGPENAAQIGFEYRDPDFWWIGATTNYFSNAYVDISAFKRTENFTLDPENGLPFNDYDPEVAQSLLQQEQLDDYFLVNLVGGKSWRVRGYYVGFFAAVSNVLDQTYRTGGFEQARRANYRTALEEANREKPIFGNKYFYGMGTSFYLNFYVKF